MQKNKSFYYLKKAYTLTLSSIGKNPLLLLPFALFSLLEFIALIVIYLAPRQPFVKVFGPPIRTLWGEIFLHYPTNFLLMDKLLSLSRMGMAVIFGSLLTGMAVYMVSDSFKNKPIKINAAFKNSIKKYIYFFVATLIVTMSFYFSARFLLIGLARYFTHGHARLLWLPPQLWIGPMLPAINFLLALVIQSALIYIIPLLVFENYNFLRAFFKTFLIFKRLFVPTLLLISVAMLVYVPITILKHSTPFLIDKTFPEFILLVAILGIVVGNLVIDAFITLSTAFLYLIYKEESK